MAWSCSELFSQEMAAACLQAEAAIRAGETQAAATSDAGWMTFYAGLLALLAALIGASFGYWGIRKQSKDAKVLQDEGQKYVAKRDVYLSVISGLYSGLLAMGRLTDIDVKEMEALQASQAHAEKVAQIHIVAPIGVLDDVLSAVAHLTIMQGELIRERRQMKASGVVNQEALIASYTKKVRSTVPVLIKATKAMRHELGLPIDTKSYERLVDAMLDKVGLPPSSSGAPPTN